MYVCAPCVYGGKKMAKLPLELNLKIVVIQLVVLETAPGFSAGSISALYHSSSSPTLSNYSNFK